jgi:uncharacterized protein (TIGR02444 family)
MSNPFWDYSLSVYNAPGVASACLSAQDDCELDVNLLLYASWLSSMDSVLTEQHLAQVDEAISGWRSRAVEPLRRLRRDLKTVPGAGDLRQQVKSLELAAERRQQELMWQCFSDGPPLPVASLSLAGNIQRVFRAAGAVDALSVSCQRRLLEALEGVAEAPAQ